jgi:hypothetical protein
MTWLSSFRKLLKTRPRRPAARPARRPRLEALEDRMLPSVSFGSAFRIGPDQPGPSGGWGQDITTDAAGNVYTTGLFDGTVDFDPAHRNTDGVLQSKNNAQNAYVAKYAADGSFVWARRMGGDGSGGPLSGSKALAVDGSGNVYVVGTFGNNADFGAFTFTGAGNFVTKLDANGNFQWVQTPAYSTSDVALDGSGNVYVTGASGGAAVVAKLDPALGATDWSEQLGGSSGGAGVSADAAGNVFVAGTFTGTVNLNPGGSYTLTSPRVKGQYVAEGFVLKLTNAGGFGWATEVAALPNDIAIDGADDVYTTGPSGNGYNGGFNGPGGPLNVTKLSGGGVLLWSENFGGFARGSNQGNPPGQAFGVAVDSAGNVYLTGYFTGTQNFNPSGTFDLTDAGYPSRAIYVSKLDANGKFLWAGAMTGSAGGGQASGIAVDGSGNICTTGLFQGTVDFDPGAGVSDLTTVSTDREIFVLKLIQT